MNNIGISKQIVVDRPINIDSPDIVKRQGNIKLSFKEIKDALFKFLMQVEIKFVGFEKLNLPVQFKSEVDENPITINTSYYTSTCKLLDITVNNDPVYIIVIPGCFIDLDKRQRNKLIFLKALYNIIIFDEQDCELVGLTISDKAWLGSLNKSILRKWSKLLLKKISELGGVVNSKFNLNTLYKNIEMTSSKTGSSIARMTILKQESLELKKKLIFNKLDSILPAINKELPQTVVEYLSKIDKNSSEWIEGLMDEVINKCLKKIDIRKNYYKEFFRSSNGNIVLADKEKIVKLISSSLKQSKIETLDLSYGGLNVKNTKTFQTVNIVFDATYSTKQSGIKFSKSLLKSFDSNVFYYFYLNFNKTTNKLYRIRGYLFVLDPKNKNKNKDYNKFRVQIFDSKEMKKYKLNFIS